jgi:HAD superfamily hydrolase (TIGR01549 family)
MDETSFSENSLPDKFLKYKGCLVDIDDTLYDYQSAHTASLHYVFSNMVQIPKRIDWITFKDTYVSYREKITYKHRGSGTSRSRFLAFQAFFEELDLKHAYMLAFEAEELYWQTLIELMRPNKNVVEFIRRLHSHGVLICAVTDMQSRIQVQKIRRLCLDTMINFMVSSEEAGCEKPDPVIFELALQKLGCEPNEVLMIGDSLIKDINGAKSFGIDTLRVHKGKLQCAS